MLAVVFCLGLNIESAFEVVRTYTELEINEKSLTMTLLFTGDFPSHTYHLALRCFTCPVSGCSWNYYNDIGVKGVGPPLLMFIICSI